MALPAPIQRHADFSGGWIRIRDVKHFMDNSVVGPEGPLFGERIVIAQSASLLRVGHENPDVVPPLREIRLDGVGVRKPGIVERVFWEIDPTSRADTLVWLIDSDVQISKGGAPTAMTPGTAESSLRMSLDSDGSLVVRLNSVAWPKGAAKPAEQTSLEETVTYLREARVKGLTRAEIGMEITGDSAACGLAAANVSATATKALSDAKMTFIEAPASRDTALVHVTVHSVRYQIPQTPATSANTIVISEVRCDSSVSVEVTDANSPPVVLYRRGQSVSGSPPDSGRWAIEEIKTSLGEFATAVRLANQSRRVPLARTANRHHDAAGASSESKLTTTRRDR
jgi:hypothetical protein